MVSDKLTDNDLMLFGEHKGKKLANVPDEYLLWLKDQPWCKKNLLDYINDNLDSLQKKK